MALFFDYHGLKSFRTLKKGFLTALTSPRYALSQLRLLGQRNLNLACHHYTERSFALSRLFLVISWVCDSRCAMCALWSEGGFCHDLEPAALKGSLQLADYEKVLTEVAPYSPEVVLFGGEPLRSEKWQAVASMAKEKGLRVALSTDGSLLEQQAEAVVRLVDHFQVSLDAATPALHNSIRQHPGLYQKLVAGVQKVDAIKRKRRQKLPLIDVGVMILPENVHELDRVPARLEEWAISLDTLNIQHLEYITPTHWKEQQGVYRHAPHLNYWQGCQRTPPVLDADLLLEKIKRLQLRSSSAFQHIAFNPEMDDEALRNHYTGKPIGKRYRCALPWTEAQLLPSGDLWICPDYYAGNICRKPFQSIWNSERAQALRSFLNLKKRLPACHHCMGNHLY